MNDLLSLQAISFDEVLSALLDADTIFPPRYLYRLSDLNSDEIDRLAEIWAQIPTWRRLALLEDIDELYYTNTLLHFEPICRLAFQDADAGIRFAALRSLLEYDVDDLIPDFIEVLERDEEVEIRALAAASLGKYVYLGVLDELPDEILRQVEESLIQAATGPAPALVQRRAIEALGFSMRPEVPALITEAFTRPENEWKASALFAMGRTCDPAWADDVLEMLDHVDPNIRLEAARAAGEIELSSAKTRLIELLDDSNQDVRMAALWSLSEIGDGDLLMLFDTLLDETESDEEASLIDEALDNLLFNLNMGFGEIMSVPDEVDETDFIEIYPDEGDDVD